MHDFSLFGFVVREGMVWLQSWVFFQRALDGHISQIFAFPSLKKR